MPFSYTALQGTSYAFVCSFVHQKFSGGFLNGFSRPCLFKPSLRCEQPLAVRFTSSHGRGSMLFSRVRIGHFYALLCPQEGFLCFLRYSSRPCLEKRSLPVFSRIVNGRESAFLYNQRTE